MCLESVTQPEVAGWHLTRGIRQECLLCPCDVLPWGQPHTGSGEKVSVGNEEHLGHLSNSWDNCTFMFPDQPTRHKYVSKQKKKSRMQKGIALI